MTLATERPHHPVRCAVAQIYAHITRGFRRVPFPEKKKKKSVRLNIQTGQSGRLATPGSHSNAFQSTLLCIRMYSHTSVNWWGDAQGGERPVCFIVLII